MRRLIPVVVVFSVLVSACGIIDPRPAPLARNCAEWSRLDAGQRLQTAEALIESELMASVLEAQQLPADTPDADALEAVGRSLDKVCEIERQPGLLLAEIVTNLYR